MNELIYHKELHGNSVKLVYLKGERLPYTIIKNCRIVCQCDTLADAYRQCNVYIAGIMRTADSYRVKAALEKFWSEVTVITLPSGEEVYA